MGWLFYHREKGESNRDHFQAKLGGEIVDCATIDGVFYAAYRIPADGLVTALVILTQWRNDEFNFGYKDMDESMGPCETKCPDRILDLLSPVEDLFGPEPDDPKAYSGARSAREWREACRSYNTTRKKSRTVKPGSVIRFDEPVRFSHGYQAQRFRVQKGNLMLALDSAGRTLFTCKFTSWRQRNDYIVETA